METSTLLDERKLFIFKIAKECYGLDLTNVKEIIKLPKVTQIPNSPAYFRGLIHLRDQIVPLFDLRICLGFPPQKSEIADFIALLHEREQDHIAWLTELTDCIAEKREFKLTTDPHACKFGKWYYSYKPENITLSDLLGKFELPHLQIHALAKRVFEIRDTKGDAAALALCEEAKSKELKVLRGLFANLYSALEYLSTEFAVIFDSGGKVVGHGSQSKSAVPRAEKVFTKT